MTVLRASITIKSDGPTCGIERTFSGALDELDDDDADGWFCSGVQDLCADCLKLQQAMIGKSKWNYIKFAPKEEVEKYAARSQSS